MALYRTFVITSITITLADTFGKIRIDELRRAAALTAPLADALAKNN